MKNKLIILVSVFLLLVANFVFAVNNAKADQDVFDCACYPGTIENRETVSKAAEIFETYNQNDCNQECFNKGYKTYIFSKNGTLTAVDKTKKIPISIPFTNTCTCDNGSDIKNKRVPDKNTCVDICRDVKAKNYKYNNEQSVPVPDIQFNTVPESPIKENNFDYKLLETLPGFFVKGSSPDFPSYISAIYSFAIWAVGISALLMISIGAFTYMTSAGNTSKMGSGKGIIVDALIGIVVALTSYLMLNIINPDLVNVNLDSLNLMTANVDTYKIIPKGTVANKDAQMRLMEFGGITVVSSGNCSDINNPKCTSLDGMPSQVIDGLINLKKTCTNYNPGCTVTVTGGTEVGHKSHGVGKPMVDVRSDSILKDFLKKQIASKSMKALNIQAICTTNDPKEIVVRYFCDFEEESAHLHLQFY